MPIENIQYIESIFAKNQVVKGKTNVNHTKKLKDKFF